MRPTEADADTVPDELQGDAHDAVTVAVCADRLAVWRTVANMELGGRPRRRDPNRPGVSRPSQGYAMRRPQQAVPHA